MVKYLYLSIVKLLTLPIMNVQIEDSWKAHLQPEFDKDYFYTLTNFVRGGIW